MERNARTVEWVVLRFMWQEVGLEIVKGFGKLFINPLFYVAILFAILLGYVRVKRERRSFRTRILWGWTEAKRMFSDIWIYALVLSILSIGIGLTLTTDWIVAYSIISILFVVLFMYQVGSPVIAGTLAIGALWIGSEMDVAFSVLNFEWFPDINWISVSLPVAFIIGAAVFVEGLLIRKTGAESASPFLEKSSRGLTVASYLSKRLWMIPILVIVPGNVIPDFFPYWPQFTLGSESFGLVLFPIVIGFQQKAKSTLPVNLFPKIGKAVMLVGIMIISLSLVAIWLPIMAVVSLVIGALGRIGIWIYFDTKERKGNYAVAPQSLGVMIAGVLPESPADKMGLVIGECIRKVNGQSVTNEQELYEAIQINAAHCRLEVLDHQGEVRLRQHVIYRHDHHRIGLLVVR
ncbi:PDZ domain-containing protein [Paenisporosarcina sp. TG-14]|uniref:PDZ domain-containing protein n=1 Tax=Paenisporosarcina sp. TG-14 TaxID=1231057 RepID=UPI001ED9C481|nr:PDZ domain-containing protein [Paenisporosarcina sp. TG-14]